MAISYEQALSIAQGRVPEDCALIEDATRELPDGWYFHFQSKAYLQSGDERELLFGHAGMIVNKQTGEVVELGSAFNLDRHFSVYQAGIHGENYDLVVERVTNLEETIKHLQGLGLSHVTPEVKYGETWRLPQAYTPDELRKILTNLPAVFPNVGIFHQFENFERLRYCGGCVVTLRLPE